MQCHKRAFVQSLPPIFGNETLLGVYFTSEIWIKETEVGILNTQQKEII